MSKKKLEKRIKELEKELNSTCEHTHISFMVMNECDTDNISQLMPTYRFSCDHCHKILPIARLTKKQNNNE